MSIHIEGVHIYPLVNSYLYQVCVLVSNLLWGAQRLFSSQSEANDSLSES